MRIFALLTVCLFTGLASSAQQQKPAIEPVHVAAGTILTFHLQARLNPSSENEADKLPKGTILRVKLLAALDSAVDHDGTEFHGVVVSSVAAGNQIIVHTDAQVVGVLALLRSKAHPEGFRYELLITRVKEQGKSYDITASLNPSFFEESTPPASSGKPTN
jgi:hypothetical protein